MSYNQLEFHNFIIKAALKVQSIYDAIIEQDQHTIKYYVTADTVTRKEMRKRYIAVPDNINMTYLYSELDKLVGEKLNKKAVVAW